MWRQNGGKTIKNKKKQWGKSKINRYQRKSKQKRKKLFQKPYGQGWTLAWGKTKKKCGKFPKPTKEEKIPKRPNMGKIPKRPNMEKNPKRRKHGQNSKSKTWAKLYNRPNMGKMVKPKKKPMRKRVPNGGSFVLKE